ncbi:MAG: ion transporter [Planctomycetota bacterium]
MLRKTVHRLLEIAEDGDRASRVVDVALGILILANVAALIVESMEPDEAVHPHFYAVFETFSVVVFAVEYALRLWSAPEDPRFVGAGGRLRYVFTPTALVDLIAIAPTMLSWFLPMQGDLRVVRALRLFRIARLAKLGRYSSAMQAIGGAIREKASELASVVFVLLVLLTVCSTMMYHVEHEANPQAFPSIPAAMWWGIATLTTVGYGDVVPSTGFGKVLGASIAILGIGVFALPAAILSASFSDRLRSKREAAAPRCCPHCGERIDAD